jgi:hypothetical protein
MEQGCRGEMEQECGHWSTPRQALWRGQTSLLNLASITSGR